MTTRRWFLDAKAVREEMEEFRREWRKEKREHGMYVPAWALYNTSFVLRELEERGLIDSDGMGRYRPN